MKRFVITVPVVMAVAVLVPVALVVQWISEQLPILAAIAVGLTCLGIDDEFSMLIVLLIAGAILGIIYNNLNNE